MPVTLSTNSTDTSGRAVLWKSARIASLVVAVEALVAVAASAVAAVDVRGGGPGTRETDLLEPRNTVREAHAIVLSGGSAFGLAAADGVMPRRPLPQFRAA